MGAEAQWQQGEQVPEMSSRPADSIVVPLEEEAGQALADRTDFALSPEAWEAWEALHGRPARDLPELRDLMAQPSPSFVD